ncbi:hypothetical protein [Lysobacter changpingensis]|uniref:hypothetical protein n=1 Tax=Lysobacter changpingensis TaxID=2792784 RepID=UPI001A8F0B55|nr:hypothetical protein [Lysobacter changpingensis]
MRGVTRRAVGWGLLGGVVAGTLDMLYATGFWTLHGVASQRIFQSVAAGALGTAAYAGGWTTAMLGLALHYLIAAMMGLAYAWAARDAPALRDRPWRLGALYGLVLYAFMTFVVVPLSASPRSATLPVSWTVCSVIAHVALVGWPCAWFARRGWDGRWSRRPVSHAFVDSTT